MTSRLLGASVAALSVCCTLAFTSPSPAFAQGAAPAPLPSPTTNSVMADKPKSEAADKLAPVAPPPIATAVDKLPISQLKVPKGFKLEPYATGMTNARAMVRGDKGTIFVSTRLLDRIYAITEKDGKREVKPLFSGLLRPNGVAFKNGTLYIAELNKISKIEKIEDNLDNPPKPTVIYDNLPSDEPHGWKYLIVGPDNKLYFNIGAPCNICAPPDTHAQLRRINLDGSGAEVIARGARQVVGMDFHPTLKQLYFSENQRDWMSEEFPQDKLNRLVKVGEDFGFPRCHQGNMPDPEFGWGKGCEGVSKPLALLGPHSAPLGVRFYTGDKFPTEYKNAVFVARHGSWNKTKKIGGDIIVAQLKADGTVKSWKPFITGFLNPQTNSYVGRPVDMINMPDGSMLISDDWNGAVYRLSYNEPKVSSR